MYRFLQFERLCSLSLALDAARIAAQAFQTHALAATILCIFGINPYRA